MPGFPGKVMSNTKILIVDDQLLFAESLKTVLETRGRNLEIVSIAANGKEALQMAGIHDPDIVLMDIRMPEMNGVEALKILKERYPSMIVIMLTTFDDDHYIHNALKNGATGYLLKNTPPEKLIASIYAAQSGMVLVSPSIIDHLTHDPVSPDPKRERPSWLEDLSNREKQVLKLITGGLNNREIAEELFIAEQTVKNHVSLIYSKIGAHDRMQAIRIAKDFL